jgi:predicted nucleic acid-binding protein
VARAKDLVLALDSGALIAAEKDQRVEAVIRKWLAEGAQVLIPAPVLAETTRGSRNDAAVNRLVKAVGFVPSVTEAIARHAGSRLAGRRGMTVDALIIATASAHGATDMLTTDADDCRQLDNGTMNIIAL